MAQLTTTRNSVDWVEHAYYIASYLNNLLSIENIDSSRRNPQSSNLPLIFLQIAIIPYM